jgi:hypothetical protein
MPWLSASATCYGCRRELPADAFPRDKSKASGRKSLCRGCDNAKSRRFYAANQRRVIARVQAYQRRAKESTRAMPQRGAPSRPSASRAGGGRSR